MLGCCPFTSEKKNVSLLIGTLALAKKWNACVRHCSVCRFCFNILNELCISTFRFDTVYLDDDIRVAKDIRGDYLVVERAPYSWNG